jgi:hypothetical protein
VTINEAAGMNRMVYDLASKPAPHHRAGNDRAVHNVRFLRRGYIV